MSDSTDFGHILRRLRLYLRVKCLLQLLFHLALLSLLLFDELFVGFLVIGGLMTIGYGEAGSRIISHNIEKGNELDPMMPGNKIISIFGFCDIRKFTNATEILREGVMIFVNDLNINAANKVVNFIN